MQKVNAKDNAVFESLRKFYYSAGESVALNMTLYVRDELTGSLESFDNVDVELMMGRGNCGIRIYCKDKDLNKYNTLGMKNNYCAKTAQFYYEEARDYQTSYKALKVQPNEFENKFILLDSKEVNIK